MSSDITSSDSASPLDDLLHEFADQAPAYLSSAVVDMENGMAMASHDKERDFDSAMAAAAYTSFIKSNREALELLGADPLDTTDILVTTNGMYMLFRELGVDYYFGVAMSQEGNLALVRRLMETYEQKLVAEIPGAELEPET
jgi:predicted regulator of Ras-like GTPase activity (Roadblock/LC7/MglB family)